MIQTNESPVVLDKARRLINGSEKRKFDPFNRVNYQETLSANHWQFPEELISLFHHPIYQELSEEQRWKLSLQEAIRFFSFNIHGEQALVAGMEPRLYRNKRVGEDPISSQYLQRFIHEENGHTYMLAGYCVRYDGGVSADRNFAVTNNNLSPEGDDALFYGRILTLEYYLGHVNKIAFDDPDLDRTPRDIHRFHHSDEVRHKAWDKVMLQENVRRLIARGDQTELNAIRQNLDAYTRYIATASVDPKPYRTIGLENVAKLRSEVLELSAKQAQDRLWIADVEQALDGMGLIIRAEES